MGYKISYGGRRRMRYCRTVASSSRKWWLAAGCGCLLVGAIWLGWNMEWVRDLLLPGDPVVTAHALQGLVNCLREGEPIVEAITAFCIEVMENARPLY